MAVLCIAMDVFICRRLRRSGYRGLAWLNGAIAVLTAALVAAVTVMPLNEASTSNSTFVIGQYLLYTFFAILAPKADASGKSPLINTPPHCTPLQPRMMQWRIVTLPRSHAPPPRWS